MQAAKEPKYFVRNIISYSAGKIYNLITRNYKLEELCSLFYFPYFTDHFEDSDVENKCRECLQRLSNYISDLKSFFSEHEFFYTQYKDGLTVALRPFNKYTEEQVEKDKLNPVDAYLAAFDNLSAKKLAKGSSRFNGMILIPHLSPTVSKNLNELLNEDNLIRFVIPKNRIDMDRIKSVAFKARDCVCAIGNNLINTLRHSKGELTLQLPAEKFGLSYSFSFDAAHLEEAADKNRFKK